MARTVPRLIPRMRASAGGPGELVVERRDASYDRVQSRAGVSTWILDLRTGELRTNAAARALLGWAQPRSSATAEELMQRAHESSLAAQAAADPLTGVSNSRTFRQELHEAVLQAGGTPLSLALIDVDRFKQVNDTFGHAVGDEALVAVVERLVAATAGAGVLARVGGEEFALLMPRTTAAQGHRVLQRALVLLASTPVGVVGTVTASAGVAELLDGMTDDALYRLADSLLYEAKARGRDQVR